MWLKLFVLLVLPVYVHAISMLESVYYVKDREVISSVVTGDEKNTFTILRIDEGDYLKKIKAKELEELLNKHGYREFAAKNSYVSFILKSPIDTSYIKQRLIERYEKEYRFIDIKEIVLEPRSYMQSLPDEYEVEIKKREHLSKEGVISIETPQKKKYFFDYYLKAYIIVYESKKSIKKGTKISPAHYIKKSVLLDDYRAKPLQDMETLTLQAKRQIPKARVMTVLDVEELDVVKRGSVINVSMKNGNMIINFTAEALKDAKVNDIISVKNSNGKIFKAKVTGRDMAVIE